MNYLKKTAVFTLAEQAKDRDLDTRKTWWAATILRENK